MTEVEVTEAIAQLSKSARGSQLSLVELVQLVQRLSKFDYALITTVTTDGQQLWQRAEVVASDGSRWLDLNEGDLWEWKAGACSEMFNASIEVEKNFSHRFPDSIWASRHLKGFVSLPIYDEDERVIGTLALLDHHGRSLKPEQLTLIRMASMVIAGELQKSIKDITSSDCRISQLKNLHGEAMNSLAAIMAWTEWASGSKSEDSRKHADEIILKRLETLRNQVNALLFTNVQPNKLAKV